MNAIINAKLITSSEVLEDSVIIFNDKILGVIRQDKFNSVGHHVIDAEGLYLAPGFIDLQWLLQRCALALRKRSLSTLPE